MKSPRPISQQSDCLVIGGPLRLLIAMLVVLLLSVPAHSQLNSGSIAGAVTDQSGGVIVGATVSVTDVQRGVTRPLTTDTAGQYTAPSLTPGEYTVRAEAMGFKTAEHTGIMVGVGQAIRVDLTLEPGVQTQTVTVTGEAPLVDASNEVISNTVENITLNELPINGRLYTKVLDFQPGIIGRPGGNSPNYTANNAGGQGNYWMLDGVENVNIFVNSGPLIGAATSTDELTIIPADAIQEVNVQANPPAEFGWFQGAVVNVGLKSGTNDIHGSVYAFGRNNSLEAYNPFLQGSGFPKADDNLEQFGASMGGPIKKDKLFYFGNYEGMRYTVGAPGTTARPTSAVLPGDNPDSEPNAINDLATAGIPLSELSLNLAGCTITPAGAVNPNEIAVGPSFVAGTLLAVPGSAKCSGKGVFPNTGTNTQTIAISGDNVGTSNNVIGKIDYHLNDKNAINGEYFFGNANTNTPNGGEAPWWDNGNHSRTQMMRGVWIYTPNSTWVNEVRFGWNRYNLTDYNLECNQQVGQPNYAGDGFLGGSSAPSPWCGFPSVSDGYDGMGAAGSINDQGVLQYTETIYDNVSYTHGKHDFKFGAEYHHSSYSGIGAPGNMDGSITFPGGNAGTVGGAPTTTLEDYFAGAASQGTILVNPPVNSVGFNRYAVYFTDDFRLTRRVTLNLGLRYELEPAILVANNQAANFDPAANVTGMIPQTGSPLYNTDDKDFAPRAGFAWDITGKGTTVLRAGMGVSYDTPQVDNLIAAGFGAGLNVFPTGATLIGANGLPVANPLASSPNALNTFTATETLHWDCTASGGTNCPGASANLPAVFVSTGSGLKIGNGLGTNPGPATIKGKPYNTDDPRSPMFTWTFGIEHAFTNNISLTVNYVGTHAYNLSVEPNINQPVLGATSTSAGVVKVSGEQTLKGAPASGLVGPYQLREQYANQFPWFGTIDEYEFGGFSNYHSLQVSFHQRGFHGLTMTEVYSFARGYATTTGGNNPTIQNAFCISCSYGPTTTPQHVGVTATYAIPGRKSPAQLLEGWEINSSLNLQSGAPLNYSDSKDDLAGIGGGAQQWDLVGSPRNFSVGKTSTTPCFGFAKSTFGKAVNAAGTSPACSPLVLGGSNGAGQVCINDAENLVQPNAALNAAAGALTTSFNGLPALPVSSGLASLEALGCYVSPNGQSVLLPPAQGTFGTMQRDAFTGAAFQEWDFSVSKKWTIRERLGIQFRAEFFNFLNNRTYSGDGSLTTPGTFGLATAAPNASNPINGTGGPREVQLGLKATF